MESSFDFASLWVAFSPVSSESRLSGPHLLSHANSINPSSGLESGSSLNETDLSSTLGIGHTPRSHERSGKQKTKRKHTGRGHLKRMKGRIFPKSTESALTAANNTESGQNCEISPAFSFVHEHSATESATDGRNRAEIGSADSSDHFPVRPASPKPTSIPSEDPPETSHNPQSTTSWQRELRKLFSASSSFRELANELLIVGLLDISDVQRWVEEQASLTEKHSFFSYANTTKTKFLRTIAKQLWVVSKFLCYLSRTKTQNTESVAANLSRNVFDKPPPEYVASKGRFNVTGSLSPESSSPIPLFNVPLSTLPRLSGTSSRKISSALAGGIINSSRAPQTARNNHLSPQIQIVESIDGIIRRLSRFSPVKSPGSPESNNPVIARTASIALSYLSYFSIQSSIKDTAASQPLRIHFATVDYSAAEVAIENAFPPEKSLSPCSLPNAHLSTPENQDQNEEDEPAKKEAESPTEDWGMARVLVAFSEEENAIPELTNDTGADTLNTLLTNVNQITPEAMDSAAVDSSVSSLVDEDAISWLATPVLNLKEENAYSQAPKEYKKSRVLAAQSEALEPWQNGKSEITLSFSEYEEAFSFFVNAPKNPAPNHAEVIRETKESSPALAEKSPSAPSVCDQYTISDENYKMETGMDRGSSLGDTTDDYIVARLLAETDTDASGDIDETTEDCRREILRTAKLWQDTAVFLFRLSESEDSSSGEDLGSSTVPKNNESECKLVLDGSETKLEHIVTSNTEQVSKLVIGIINNYRRVFPHLTRTVVQPCNEAIKGLVEKVLSLRRTEVDLFSQGNDINSRIITIRKSIGHREWVGSGPCTRRIDGCCVSLVQMEQSNTCLRESLAALEAGFQSRIADIQANMKRIIEVRQRILKSYDAFSQENAMQGSFEAQDIDELTKANEYRRKTVWHMHMNLEGFERLLCDDLKALVATEDCLSEMASRIRTGLEEVKKIAFLSADTNHKDAEVGNTPRDGFHMDLEAHLDKVKGDYRAVKSHPVYVSRGKSSKKNPIEFPRPS